jgi:general secretion pathway protein G
MCGRFSTHRRSSRGARAGFSLLELLAVITLMGIIAAIAVPRIGTQSQKTKATACNVQRGNIDVQAQLWFRNRGRWPARDLNDIADNTDYFPDGLPVCPVDGSAYVFDSANQQVIEHDHME